MFTIPRVKVAPSGTVQQVEYTSSHWRLLRRLRGKAEGILKEIRPLHPILHGSVARGDVTITSDIDIVITRTISEYQIQFRMEKISASPVERWIIQATPLSAVKAHIVYPENVTISYPLIPLYPREIEFYHFGGALSYEDLVENKRVPGINKALFFIEPTKKGHRAFRFSDLDTGKIAKILGISIDTINERVRVLERRDKLGRTGVFLRRQVGPEESFGHVLSVLAKNNPAVRRRMRRIKS
ncbi:MAG: nucleotidyltransferase domain-containing protein [Candidatus Ranarchaeia archaeon]